MKFTWNTELSTTDLIHQETETFCSGFVHGRNDQSLVKAIGIFSSVKGSFMILGSFSKPRRRRRRERYQTQGSTESAKQWFCKCVSNLATFLRRPLQNKNVKWPSSTVLERESNG